MLSWDDLRFFLAVHRGGHLAAASRRLQVDATTVGRRIDVLEQELDASLFVRRRGAWSLTTAGEQVLEAAERAERAVAEVKRKAVESEGAPEGRVRLTTVEAVATYLVAPTLPELARTHPGVSVDLLCTVRVLDLERGEADVAIRLGRPRESSLKARKLATFVERPHASRAWLEARGADPDRLTRLDGAEILTILQRSDEAELRRFGDVKTVLRTSSGTSLISACAAGLGVALVPDLLAAADDRLVLLPGLDLTRESTLWLVFHEDVGRQARVRAVMDHLVAHCGRLG